MAVADALFQFGGGKVLVQLSELLQIVFLGISDHVVSPLWIDWIQFHHNMAGPEFQSAE